MANVMAESMDRVWFVVSPHNPFKKTKSLLHEFDRFEMVEKAVQDNHKLEASDVEFGMPKPNYTIDTLTYLKEKHPGHTFKLIIGSDNLSQFPRWKNYQKIIENFGLLVYPRPSSQDTELLEDPRITMIDAPLLHISASFIRNSIKEKKSIRYLVPEVIAKYIEKKGYYL